MTKKVVLVAALVAATAAAATTAAWSSRDKPSRGQVTFVRVTP